MNMYIKLTKFFESGEGGARLVDPTCLYAEYLLELKNSQLITHRKHDAPPNTIWLLLRGENIISLYQCENNMSAILVS